LAAPSVYGLRTLTLPLRIAKLSGLHDLSFDFSLLAIERSTQFFASEMQAVRRLEDRSKEAASAHSPSCIFEKSQSIRFNLIVGMPQISLFSL
jgi:hypothetical protein